mmetsp:Transcript_14331/g.61444  ORF Transcript_14331/g.61444 Transcript_14331/m.61444 type:complete len:353 (+) Transcript_14331:152-1210(+)
MERMTRKSSAAFRLRSTHVNNPPQPHRLARRPTFTAPSRAQIKSCVCVLRRRSLTRRTSVDSIQFISYARSHAAHSNAPSSTTRSSRHKSTSLQSPQCSHTTSRSVNVTHGSRNVASGEYSGTRNSLRAFLRRSATGPATLVSKPRTAHSVLTNASAGVPLTLSERCAPGGSGNKCSGFKRVALPGPRCFWISPTKRKTRCEKYPSTWPASHAALSSSAAAAASRPIGGGASFFRSSLFGASSASSPSSSSATAESAAARVSSAPSRKSPPCSRFHGLKMNSLTITSKCSRRDSGRNDATFQCMSSASALPFSVPARPAEKKPGSSSSSSGPCVSCPAHCADVGSADATSPP